MLIRTLFLSTIILFSSTNAGADAKCQATMGRDKLALQIDPTGEKSNVTYNGKNVPRVGNCWIEDRPSTRNFHCSYQSNDVRVEVYHWVETTSGNIRVSQVILWRGDSPEAANLECN